MSKDTGKTNKKAAESGAAVPEDHKAPKGETMFSYDSPAGKVELPKFAELPFGVLRKMRKMDEDEVPFFLIEATATESNLEIVDTLSIEQVGELFTAWQADSGITAPESSASSGS